jgi:hypothetical protein
MSSIHDDHPSQDFIEDDFELSEDIIFHHLPMEKTIGSL